MIERIEEFEAKIELIREARHMNEFHLAQERLDDIKFNLNRTHKLEKVLAKFREKFILFETTDLQPQISKIFEEQGKILEAFGDYKGARKYFVVALKMRQMRLRSMPNDKIALLDVAYSAFNAAKVVYVAGIFDDELLHLFNLAKTRAQEAILYLNCEFIDDILHLGNMHHNLAFIGQSFGDFVSAVSTYEQALIFQRKAMDVRGAGASLAGISQCYAELSNINMFSALQEFKRANDFLRISRLKKNIENNKKFSETVFREMEKNSILVKKEKESAKHFTDYMQRVGKGRGGKVNMNPDARAVSILEIIKGEIQAIDEGSMQDENTHRLISLFSISFLEEISGDYKEVEQFLSTIDMSVESVGRLNKWKTICGDRTEAALLNLEHGKIENRREFAKRIVDAIRGIMLQSLAFSSENKLWLYYLKNSSFLNEMKALSLLVVKGCEFEIESKYSEKSIGEAFGEEV